MASARPPQPALDITMLSHFASPGNTNCLDGFNYLRGDCKIRCEVVVVLVVLVVVVVVVVLQLVVVVVVKDRRSEHDPHHELSDATPDPNTKPEY